MLASSALTVLSTGQALAANFDVTDSASFVTAIASAGNGDTITIQNSFTMAARVDPISANVTIVGNGNTIDANSAFRPFFVNSGTVAIQNLTVANGLAKGGDGGGGLVPGGGGMGAGGAIFVNSGASVAITNVTFSSNQATGGSGGTINTSIGTGGGGGLGGSGGTSTGAAGGGGGGLFGAGGASLSNGGGGGGGLFGGGAGAVTGGGGGGGSTGAGTAASGSSGGAGGTGGGANGGNNGVAGSTSATFGGGGGGGGNSANGGSGASGGGGGGSGNGSASGGGGGDFGGGGGGYLNSGGAGGFGGGGGGANTGGDGGFGGGGGGDQGATGTGGTGAASGTNNGGGGGAGLGGAVFVRQGGTLTITDGSVGGTNGVTAGTGSGGAFGGAAAGSGLFLMTGTTTTFNPTTSLTIAGTIADDSANSLGGGGGTYTAGAAAGAAISKTGAGTLTLSGLNTYSGGTTISAGTVSLGQLTFFNPGALSSGLGLGAVALDGGKLQTTVTGSLANDLTFNANKTSILAAAAGTTLTLGGDPNISGNTATNFTLGANAVAQFGTATDTGTIRIGASSNTPTIDFSSSVVVAGGKLQDFQDGLWQVLSGVNSLTINAGATVDYNNSASQVIVNLNGAGSLASGTAGTNTLTIFSTTGSTNTFSGVISGSHPVSFNTTGGAATMILTGENTYTGGTTICSCGTLQLGNGGTTGSILGDVDNEGTLIFNRSNSYTFNGVISDTGNVIHNGAGTTFLSADNTYSGGTTVNAGRLVVGNGGTTGSIVGNVTVQSGAAFGVNRSDTYTLPNAISGAGGFVQLGTGTTIFNTAQAYAGDTTISAGTLQIGNGGVAGSLASTTIVDNATLAINKSNSYGLAANISGTGGLNQIGGGTTSLTGANTYAGSTNVTAGILRAGASGAFSPNSAFNIGSLGTLNLSGFDQTIGSLAGSGAVLLSTAILTTGNDNTGTTYSGGIQGAGGVTKTGSGNFVLSGTSTYTGATTVNAGTLSVNGDISSSSGVTVNSGGTLGGTGNVPDVVVGAGGTLAPGNSVGTITVSGNLTFNSGSTYAVELSSAGADRTNVTGTATLAGTVAVSSTAGSSLSNRYTILSAGTRSGTFSSLTTSNLPSGFGAALSYSGNDVLLDLSLTSPGGLPINQQNAFNAINTAFINGSTLPAGFVTLAGSSNPVNAYGQVAGEPGASSAQGGILAMGQFINTIFDAAFGDNAAIGGATGFAQDDRAKADAPNKEAADNAAEAYAAVTPRDRGAQAFAGRWGVWASAYGGNSSVDGDASVGSNKTKSSAGGVVAGANYSASPNLKLGFAVGGAGTSFTLDNGFGSGKGDMFTAAAYGKYNFGPAYVAGALAYGWQDASTDRTVTVSGTDKLHAAFQANALAGRIEGGWRFATPMLAMTPYAALQSTTFFLPAYSETATSGSNQFALSYAAHNVTATRGEIGARFEKAMETGDGLLTLKAKAAWAHDWNSDRAATATFQQLPAASFVVNGAQPAADALLASLGAGLDWHNGWSVLASFDTELASSGRVYGGKGVLRYTW